MGSPALSVMEVRLRPGPTLESRQLAGPLRRTGGRSTESAGEPVNVIFFVPLFVTLEESRHDLAELSSLDSGPELVSDKADYRVSAEEVQLSLTLIISAYSRFAYFLCNSLQRWHIKIDTIISCRLFYLWQWTLVLLPGFSY